MFSLGTKLRHCDSRNKYHKYFPLRNGKHWPWIDKSLRDLMCTRDKLKKSAVKGKSPILMNSYRQIRNKVNAPNVQRHLLLFYSVQSISSDKLQAKVLKKHAPRLYNV